MNGSALTDEDLEILDFERAWWRYPGAKEAEVRRHWGLNATRYYQRLNIIIDSRAALERDPVLVNRLRRLRENRRRHRADRRQPAQSR